MAASTVSVTTSAETDEAFFCGFRQSRLDATAAILNVPITIESPPFVLASVYVPMSDIRTFLELSESASREAMGMAVNARSRCLISRKPIHS